MNLKNTDMKSIQKVAKENKKTTIFTVIAAIVGVATIFIDQAEILGVSTEIVKWVSFGISALTAITTYINSNLNR